MGRRTPLYDVHRQLGARIVDFAGWDMPVSYASALEEHHAVRERCGLFDVSHMGQLEFLGPAAAQLAQRVTTNDVRRLDDGVGQYTIACADDGGVVDDLILYRLGPERYLAVVNAAHTVLARQWVERAARRIAGAQVVDVSERWAMFALQGPMALRALAAVAGPGGVGPGSFTIVEGTIADVPVLVSRTGYTGEDGVEVFVPANGAQRVWDAMLRSVRNVDGRPAGLAARDTLRLEASLPLCGTDMDDRTTPLEAGLGWAVRFVEGNEFIGRAALEAQTSSGEYRRLVCFVMDEPGVPRTGCELRRDGGVVGRVTSGARSPTLDRFIGMGYVRPRDAAQGTAIEVLIRGRPVAARVVPRPFYRRRDRTGRSDGDPEEPTVHA